MATKSKKCPCGNCAGCSAGCTITHPCCRCKTFVKETMEWFCLVQSWLGNESIPPSKKERLLEEDIASLKGIFLEYRDVAGYHTKRNERIEEAAKEA